MPREDFVYVNLDRGLVLSVDKAVEELRLNNTHKYRDRKDFVTKAIHELLAKEGIKKKEVVTN